jgi:hypothetical protein
MLRMRTLPAGFILPCLPTKTDKLPSGSDWLHEIKHDGFRIIASKKGAQVRLYSRPGNDLTHRFPLIAPESRYCSASLACPLRAKTGHWPDYSINSSATASSEGGTVRPSAWAVLRLMTNSYLVGACTGRSFFPPPKIKGAIPCVVSGSELTPAAIRKCNCRYRRSRSPVSRLCLHVR